MWTVSSWLEARLESGRPFRELDDLVVAADALVADHYPSGPERATAELQYAIYPWTLGGELAAMFDVTGRVGDLVASDIVGSHGVLRGKTASGLVEAASSALGETPQAMFRWIKKISELPG